MKNIMIFIASLLVLSGCCDKELYLQIEQSEPFMRVLSSAQSSNISEFQQSYSKRIREEDAQGDWQKNINEAKENLSIHFGELIPNDLSFKFDSENSKLGIFHKGQLKLWMEVIEEDGEWKLNER